MKIKNINQLITDNGDTNDIIKTVMYAYEVENDEQLRELANKLQAKTTVETCRNIWQYLIDNVRYVADSTTDKGEMIRTPARLLHDKVGDCKSYSLFTAVILRYLNIPHVFRFVSYTNAKQATHVYIVANGNIVIDAVAFKQLNYEFGREVPYKYKVDMSNSKTKISYLAGFQNRIGDVETAFNNGEQLGEYTRGKAFIFSMIDLYSEIDKHTVTADNRAMLVYFYSLLFAYDSVNGDTDLFHEALKRITSMLMNDAIDATDPDRALNWIMNNSETYPIDADIESSDIYKLLLNEVVNDNEFDTVEFDTVGVSGFDPIAPALKKAGMYFIYLFIPENELNKYPDAVAKKRKTQNALFKIIHTVDIFHSSQTVLNFFRAGIVAKTGMQPEKYIADVKLKNVRQSIGITFETVTAILGAVYSLILILSKLFPKSKAAEFDYKNGAADMQNEIYSSQTGTGLTKKNNTLLYAGAGLLAAVLIFKNKKAQ